MSLSLSDDRRSVPSRLLTAPGPDDAALLRMLHSAVQVPDHGNLVPYRFLRIAGAARAALGEVLARRHRERDPDAPDAVIDKDRARFSNAPLVLAVIARPIPGHKVPEIEQILSAGCVCFALLHAAHAQGYGAQWLTSWAAYDPIIGARLGLGEHERILGFIHIGTPNQRPAGRPRPDPQALLSDWSPDA